MWAKGKTPPAAAQVPMAPMAQPDADGDEPRNAGTDCNCAIVQAHTKHSPASTEPHKSKKK